jgi:kynureninase
MTMQTREDALARDRADPLAPLREAFVLPDGLIYLDGNSLGALPRGSLARAQQVVAEEWGQGLIGSWNQAGWYLRPRTIGDRLGRLIGAEAGETVLTDSISVNLFKLLAAGLTFQQARDPARRVIVAEHGSFPSDLYIIQGLVQLLGEARCSLRLIDGPAGLDAALGPDVALVLLTQVDYRTGALYDLDAITRQVQGAGALMVWDLAHSAGALPVDLNAAGADGAVGCTYKYLNAGPGAPAFIWVPRRHHTAFFQPISGWWGHRAPFAMQTDFMPEDGIGRFLCGTPPIVSLSLVEPSLEVFERTSMYALREKSLALTQGFIDLVDARCAGLGLGLATPREGARRGSQVSLTHPHAYPIVQALIARGVVGDFREPDILRFGFTPLYVRFVDVWDAVEVLRDVMQTGVWREARFAQRHAVT